MQLAIQLITLELGLSSYRGNNTTLFTISMLPISVRQFH